MEELQVITPKMAESYLATANENNRPLNERRALELAQEMTAGRWRDIGDSIRFDRNGMLLDGQHRLRACVLADTPITFRVLRGLDPSAFELIDTGKPRTAADALSVRGFSHAKGLASAARYTRWMLMGCTFKPTTRATPQAITRLLTYHPALEDSHDCVKSNNTVFRRKGAAAAVHYTLGMVDEKVRDQFFGLLENGSGLKPGSPVLVLRDRLISGTSVRNSYDTPVDTMRLMLHGWDLWHSGKSIRYIRTTGISSSFVGAWVRKHLDISRTSKGLI